MADWPETRPVGYAPDKGYDESNEVWTDDDAIILKSGGRNKEQLIVVGYGKIYFGSS